MKLHGFVTPTLHGSRGGSLRLSERIPRPDFVFHGATATPQGDFDHVHRVRLPYNTSGFLQRSTPFGPGVFKNTVTITATRLVSPQYLRFAQPLVGHALLWIENCGTNTGNFNLRPSAQITGLTRGIGITVRNAGVSAYAAVGGTTSYTPDLPKASVVGRLVSASFHFTPTTLLFFADGELIGSLAHVVPDGLSGDLNEMRMSNASGAEPTLAVLQQAFFRGPDEDFAQQLSAEPGMLWESRSSLVPVLFAASAGGPPTLESIMGVSTGPGEATITVY